MRQHAPDHRLAHASVLELQRRRDFVACQFFQPLGGEIVASGVAQQHEAAETGMAAQPAERPGRHLAFVADVTRDHDVGRRDSRGIGEPVGRADVEAEPVGLAIQPRRNQR